MAVTDEPKISSHLSKSCYASLACCWLSVFISTVICGAANSSIVTNAMGYRDGDSP
jgi:hypothetical protein